MLREAAAFDGGKPFSDGIDLGDIGPAGEQLFRHVLQHAAGHERRFEQRAPSSGEEKEDRVRFVQSFRQRQSLPGGGEGVLVRDRMPGFQAGHSRDRAPDMAVFGDDDPRGEPVAERVFRRARHLPGGLAHRHRDDPSGKAAAGERPPHGLVRKHRLDGAGDDISRVLSHGVKHM